MSLFFLALMSLAAPSPLAPVILEESVVDTVWAGHYVGFCLLTHPPHQFAAYYDADRHMTVARRTLGETQWQHVTLPENVVWDSHNSVTMALDQDGHLHVSGNMHVKPLVYFRTEQPYDIGSFARLAMTGERETRCTYPAFLTGADHRLIFTYRDGASGNGDQLFNVYDAPSKSWHRLLEQPFTSGEGKMNAYFQGPVPGPDGRFHLCWVWRDSGNCNSNHDPCYARSADLVHWENSAGKPLTLPITLATADIVDPVPVKGGIINGNTKLGFDSLRRPVISYHKYDGAGNTQIYNARFEEGTWKICQASHWDYRWDFDGGGTIEFKVGLSGVSAGPPGQLKQTYHYPKASGGWLLDEATLKPVGTYDEAPRPAAMNELKSSFPGMGIRRAGDLGGSDEPGVTYVMQWETLGVNRDKPRPGPLPAAAPLRVFKLR